jgi:hypothetical protein
MGHEPDYQHASYLYHSLRTLSTVRQPEHSVDDAKGKGK